MIFIYEVELCLGWNHCFITVPSYSSSDSQKLKICVISIWCIIPFHSGVKFSKLYNSWNSVHYFAYKFYHLCVKGAVLGSARNDHNAVLQITDENSQASTTAISVLYASEYVNGMFIVINVDNVWIMDYVFIT